MKRLINYIAVALLLVAIAPLASHAQFGHAQLDLRYNYAIPTGDFKANSISNASPRGFGGSLMYMFNNDQMGLGADVSFQDYYQKYDRAVYANGKSEDISAVLTNSIQTTPVMAKFYFAPGRHGAIRPYVSAAAGINIIDDRQYLGEFGDDNSSVGFIAQGGAGLVIPFGPYSRAGLTLGGTFNYAPYNKYGVANLNTFGLQAGVHFAL